MAVLIAAEMADMPDLKNNSEFWFDTVLTYCMLRNNGFTDENIYVIYGDGIDPALEQLDTASLQSSDPSITPVPGYYISGSYCREKDRPDRIVDFPMTVSSESGEERYLGCEQETNGDWHCGPIAILDCLASGCNAGERFDLGGRKGPKIEPLTHDDYLFVWWKGHGGQPEEAEESMDDEYNLKIGGGHVSRETLRRRLDAVPAASRLYVFETCKSGCLSAELGERPGTILLTACGCAQEVAQNWKTHDAWHGVFSFWIAGTLGGSLPLGSKNPIYGTEVNITFGQSVADAFEESEQATRTEVGKSVNQHPVLTEPTPPTSRLTHLNNSPPTGQPADG